MSDQDYSKIGQNAVLPNNDSSFDVDELQMRATLGLSGRGRGQLRSQPATAPKQRHRFVQDGEVQVIHLSGQRDGDATATLRGRITALEAALEAEQAARARADHSVQAGIAQIHALETKLAHVELAGREGLGAERQARELVESELRGALLARDAAQQALESQRVAVDAPAVLKVRVKRVVKPKAGPRVKEPQPVKWWLGKSAAH